MQGEFKISIISSVFKVEPYIREFIQSLLDQTYKNLEIILIDDGSPDECGAICDKFASVDPRILVYHKKNQGLSAGWNDGIKRATGEWVAFVDPDDWVSPTFFEELIESSKLDKADIIVANAHFRELGDRQEQEISFDKPFFFEDGTGREFLMIKTIAVGSNRNKREHCIPYAWNKLYRRNFLIQNKLFFNPDIPSGLPNDALFNFEAFAKAKNVQGILCCGYHYRVLQEAGTLRFRPERPQQMIRTFELFDMEINSEADGSNIKKMLNARILADIKDNLNRCYFHPDNTSSYYEIAKSINEMKKTYPYKRAIWQKDNQFLPMKLLTLKYILRLPWIWPLRILYAINEGMKIN